ncbi:dephospho-CoA kinase [Dechloromonas sp. TW-R-39-2]|uniref:dephospho-CoA kinase n=1 Tax=Dechloromonas sp. TW-R-39-2 TaxID=2654218 RepID=UPI00193CD2B8|nr:dephospho-CoA kinase [Dechloromonas sp. TW-R-39-2]QRM20844.1 dephospho-CoA kinase [Dechloromonas sp. TW-R-39-2]
MSDYVVGLTGGIGSGKSTVADLFAAKGIAVIDTDALAHELTAAQGAAMPALLAAFGPSIADASGAMDRAAMRRLVFADASARARLEAILHPMIRRISDERCRLATSPYVILAVPLLVESGSYRERCDRIVAVDCPESRQIERVMVRSQLTEKEVRAIVSAQATRQQRLDIADDVVNNDGALTILYGQVDRLHLKYLSLSAEKAKAKC